MFGDISAIDLARFQFAFTVSAISSFPPSRSGSRAISRCSTALWLWTRDEVYLRLFDYWKTIFAVVFGMGVVSGIVMTYQFGTNWSVFSDKAGPVIGPLMGYEVLSAFFLEAGFLGIMLFGRERVGERLHMVADGHGGHRHADLGLLDPHRQQLDADARRATRSTRSASSCPRTGGRSSSTRPSPTGSCTWCWRPT